MNSNKDVQLASPIATGGGGTEFEYKVDAAFLALLLVNGPVPFLGTATLDELHLQAGHLGWKTDDLLLVARSPDGERRRAAVQVKRNFAISRSNSECLETFKRAWCDFHAADRFDRSKDRLGVITPAPSQRFLRGFRGLLDAARASTVVADFKNRLSLAKYLPAETKEFAAVIREVCEPEHVGDDFDDAFLAFLKRLDFACLDLDGDSPTVALLRGLLSAHADGNEDADDVWSDLVRFAAEGASRAQSIVRSDLPEPLRRLLRTTTSRSAEALRRLSRMTDVVVGVTRRTIAGYYVARPAVAQLTIDAIEEHEVVLLVGNAGAGKSALATEIFEELRRDRLAIALRAVQLATSHLAEVMSHQGLGLPHLDELFALHPRKIALIESAERLLETGYEQRSAFVDFLQLTSRAPGWKLIITCRDYHAEIVRDVLLQDVAHGVVRIPVFSDDELAAVAAAVPQLGVPLTSTPLRELLRSPFLLDKAARLDWAGTELPDSLRLFRRKVWKQLVRREDEQADGLPARRADALVTVAVRRATLMVPFVTCHDLPDKAALHALARDGLLLENPDSDDSFAPGHDVLEDWAVLEWLDREFDAAEGNWRSLIARVGTEPAIRRAVRLWVTERISLEPDDAKVLAVVTDRDVEQHWRYDLLAGIVMSKHAEAFLRRNRAALVAEDCMLLRLFLQVVRVGCRRMPDNVVPKPELAPLTLVPDGPAWAVLAEFLADSTTIAALPRAFTTSLQFIQDWSGSITEHSPYPDGSLHVASLAAQLLPLGQKLGYLTRDRVCRFLLTIIFALPKEGQELIDGLVAQTIGDPSFELEEHVRAVVLSHFTGRAMARDRPDLVFQLLEREWGLGVNDDGPWSLHDLDTVERAFGFPRHSRRDHFPASSFQGPWANLFTHHSVETLDVVIRLVNRACETYAKSPHDLEQAKRYDLQPPGGTALSLWGNSRIYNMFRGSSGAYALQSALMALERSLLERAAVGDGSLGSDLDRILVEANNIALAAIVTSVMTASPNCATRTSLAVLSCPALFDLDRERSVNDQMPPSLWLEYTSGDARDRVLAQERFESAQLRHRKEDLEALCFRLQFTNLRKDVQSIIDSHRASLPPEDTQTDDQRLWRLLLHRCDLRNFEKGETLEDGRVTFRPRDPPADIAAVVENRAPVIAEMSEESYLFVWAASVFDGKQDHRYPANAWHDALRRARNFERSAVAMRGDRPAARVAITCARDHWLELTTEERDWCLAKIETATQDVDGRRIGSTLDGSREAAVVLPLLLSLAQEDVREQLLAAVFRTLTHDDDGVQIHAASGIGRYLWTEERVLGRGLVRALLGFVEVARTRLECEEADQDHAAERATCRELVRATIEAEITNADLIVAQSVDYRARPWHSIVKPLCALFRHLPEEECARAFFAHLFQQLVAEWTGDAEAGPRIRREHGFDRVLEHNVEDRLAEFCVRLDPADAGAVLVGLVDAVPLHADKVAGLLKDLINAVAQLPAPRPAFWHLWQAIADALVECTSTERLLRRDSGHAELARALLLFDTRWKNDIAWWEPLFGEESRMVTLFDRLPANPEVLVAFVHFLCKFGKPILPGAVVKVKIKIASNPEQHSLSSNAVSWLEVLLGRLVYGGDAALRRPGEIREAVMWLLDVLVDHGSSAGFRMRDDFLTPARPQLVHGV